MDWEQFDQIYISSIPKNIEDTYNIIKRDNLPNVIIFQGTNENENEKLIYEYKGIRIIPIIEDSKVSNRLKNSYAHKTICKHAQMNKYKRILIFEDDAMKTNNVSKKTWEYVSNWIKNNDWDIFFLGHVAQGLIFPINEHVNRTFGSVQTHAFCLNEKMIDRVINFYNPSNEAPNILKKQNKKGKKHGLIDAFLRSECMNKRAYTASPNLYYQKREVPEIVIGRKILFSNASVQDWPEKINNLILCISIILCLITPLSIIILFKKLKLKYIKN